MCNSHAARLTLRRRPVVLQSSAMAKEWRMWRRLKPRAKRRYLPGAKPGAFTIDPDAPPTTIRVMAYDRERVVEQQIEDPHALKELLDKWPVVWIDVAGLGSEDKLRAL